MKAETVKALAVLVWGLLAAGPLVARTVTPQESPGSELQEQVIRAARPGPVLWKVSSGDHVLWVLGTVPVLPKHVKWQTDDIERVLASSQALLKYPGVMPDARIGVFSFMGMLPLMIHIGDLPGGATLQQSLPAPLYARWTTQRLKYFGDGARFERLRPFVAVEKLTNKAYDSIGLIDGDEVEATVQKLAKKHRVTIVDPQYRLFIKDPKTLIRDFKSTSVDEAECFAYELDALDHTLLTASSEADAWAMGDVATLRSTIRLEGPDPCLAAWEHTALARDLGVGEIAAKVNSAWLAAAEKALTDNQQSVALLEMSDVMSPDGLLAMLAADGYAIQAPGEAGHK